MKFRVCSKCGHKVVSFSEKCEKCGDNLRNEKVYEKPAPPPETVQDHYLKKFLISIAILVVLAIVSFVLRLN